MIVWSTFASIQTRAPLKSSALPDLLQMAEFSVIVIIELLRILVERSDLWTCDFLLRELNQPLNPNVGSPDGGKATLVQDHRAVGFSLPCHSHTSVIPPKS